MRESTLRGRVLQMLKELDAVPVENPAMPGTPDVEYIGGWIELKQVACWPPRGGPLRVDHLTPQQRAWLVRRSLRGGRADLLLQVAQEYLLLAGPVAARHLGYVARGELVDLADAYWPNGLRGPELLAKLRS